MSDINEVESALISIPGLTRNLLDYFLSNGQIKEVKKKDFIIRTGDTYQNIGIVIKGIFRGFYLKDGEEISTWFSSENEVIASYMNILSDEPSKLTYQALEESEVFVTSYAKIKEISSKDSEVLVFINTLLEKQLLESYQRFERYVLQSPEERFKNLLEQKPEIFNRVSQRMLASYVGVTPVSLSRIKARLTPKNKR